MIRVISLLALTALSSFGDPWTDIFKPQPQWQPAENVTADGSSLTFEVGSKPTFFTNAAAPKKSGYLQTVASYGDCTIETEFMIPKDSNSGIYVMGRYEIQILDSYGKKEVDYGDLGGIYQRVDPTRNPAGFGGVAPAVNAAKPAGEWQSMIIKFRAPRLDSEGKLLEKPRFLSVVLNGKTVQSNVTLHGHTNSAQREGWVAKDALFIQGDHGPIAFRKFKVTPENFEQATGKSQK